MGLTLRLRSDEQLVALFRAGNDDAFDVIHDRYRQRLFAYTRQMLPGSRQDAEDALQDVFVRAFGGLRASNRQLALRAWLYRVAHNRCIDELRRPPLPSPEALEFTRPPASDPTVIAEQRDTLRRLIEDVRRLPEQQRSALLMRELSDMTYAELAAALDASVPAVKSLLVRARIGLAKAAEARDIACSSIREDLAVAHDRGVRPSGTARRHLRDCSGCREFRRDMRGVSRQLAALTPALGPAGVLAKLVGFGGGASGTAAGGSAAVAGGGAFTGGILTGGVSHLATLIAAAVITAGGAVELQQSIAPVHHSAKHHVAPMVRPSPVPAPPQPSTASTGGVSPSGPYSTPTASSAAAMNSASSPASSASGDSATPTGTSVVTDAVRRYTSGSASGLGDMTAPAGADDTTDSGTSTPTGTGSSGTGTSGTGSTQTASDTSTTIVTMNPDGTISLSSPSSGITTSGGSSTSSSSGTGSSGTPGSSGSDTSSTGSGTSSTGSGTSSTGSGTSSTGSGTSGSDGTSATTASAGTDDSSSSTTNTSSTGTSSSASSSDTGSSTKPAS